MKYLTLLLLIVCQISNAQYKGEPAKAGGYSIGDIASDFSLKNVDGKMVSLADYPDANGYVIVFTCNHCPYSVMYEDRLIALDKKIKPMGYHLIAINPNDPAIYEDDTFEKMIVRAKEKGFTFPYVYDDGQKIFPQYGATKTPHIYLLDGDRKVIYIGAMDDSARDESAVEETYLKNAIMAHSKGEKIEPATTKAIGCSIRVMK